MELIISGILFFAIAGYGLYFVLKENKQDVTVDPTDLPYVETHIERPNPPINLPH